MIKLYDIKCDFIWSRNGSISLIINSYIYGTLKTFFFQIKELVTDLAYSVVL